MSGMSVPSTTSATSWRIAEVARLVDLTPRAIRHYEGMGLLRPSRSKGAYRLYDDADVERLRRVIPTGKIPAMVKAEADHAG